MGPGGYGGAVGWDDGVHCGDGGAGATTVVVVEVAVVIAVLVAVLGDIARPKRLCIREWRY